MNKETIIKVTDGISLGNNDIICELHCSDRVFGIIRRSHDVSTDVTLNKKVYEQTDDGPIVIATLNHIAINIANKCIILAMNVNSMYDANSILDDLIMEEILIEPILFNDHFMGFGMSSYDDEKKEVCAEKESKIEIDEETLAYAIALNGGFGNKCIFSGSGKFEGDVILSNMVSRLHFDEATSEFTICTMNEYDINAVMDRNPFEVDICDAINLAKCYANMRMAIDNCASLHNCEKARHFVITIGKGMGE